jgi:hypothetical protein
MGIHACAPKRADCPALALGSSDAREGILDAVRTGNSGLCTFSDEIGRLTGLRARVVVSSTDAVNYSWNGTYSFSPVPEKENERRQVAVPLP